jgi:GGDEF domain-containing protein
LSARAGDPGPVRPAASDLVAGWPARVGRAIGSAAGAAVSVLAVDVDDVERLVAADGDGDIARALEQVEHGLAAILDRAAAGDGPRTRPDASSLRRVPADIVALGIGRYGITAPELDADGAHALGERLAAAVAAAAAPRGVPLRASVGVATSPADGADPATLIARAEERALAARASGAPLA